MQEPDATHNPQLLGWPDGAAGHPDFPVQNLPLGLFAPPGETVRGGVAIGECVLDLAALAETGLLAGAAETAARAASGSTLAPLLALGAGPRQALRQALSGLLSHHAQAGRVAPCLHPLAACRLALPVAVGDYTDFYAGIHHATRVGRLFRPDTPLLPNYKHVPIGYHGRASSLVVSGTDFHRPRGQTAPAAGAAQPDFGPTRRLDYELELGIWVGPGQEAGATLPIATAGAHIAGYSLLNDWSARDLQAFEYQPLGPFLAKNFCTTLSPWIITPEALVPFRLPQPPRPPGDPAPLPYLTDPADQAHGALAMTLTVTLSSAAMRQAGLPAITLCETSATQLYWTPAQLLAHHASNGCPMRPGDLLGTGTISGPNPGECGSLLERTEGGKIAVELPTGERRLFLEDGDEVALHATARAPGFVPIGFGPCQAMVLPAPPPTPADTVRA